MRCSSSSVLQSSSNLPPSTSEQLIRRDIVTEDELDSTSVCGFDGSSEISLKLLSSDSSWVAGASLAGSTRVTMTW